ncbi:MAG: OmpA family protein [Candidatus Kapaibacteriales bacterium]
MIINHRHFYTKKFATLLLFAIPLPYLLWSADTMSVSKLTFTADSVNSYGFFFGNSWNNHIADFQKLPGIPNCCKGFRNGTGTGLSASVFMEIPLPFALFAGMRATFIGLNGWLKEKEYTWVRLQDDTVHGVFEHNLKVQYSSLGLEPNLRWNFMLGASISIGARIAFPVGKKFQQWESLVEPAESGVFTDTQSRRRNEYAGNIPDAKLVQTDLNLGFEYAFPLNKPGSLLLVPNLIYRFGLTNLVTSLNWKINSFQLQLALRYRPVKITKPIEVKPIEEFEKKYFNDTMIVENENVRSNKFVVGKEIFDTTTITVPGKIIHKITVSRTDTIFRIPKPTANISTNTSSIHVSTHFVTQAFPLLPILFFERNSAEITGFYAKINGLNEFDINKLPTQPLELNREILNIIGYRMLENPVAKITIWGYSDSTTEAGNCRLARRRAESVKNYLTQVWKIPSRRILIRTNDTNCIPKERTITQNDSGFAENRRVEITSDNPQILEPVSKRRYLEILDFKPDTLIFDPTESKVFGVRNWKIEVFRGEKPIFVYSDTGKLQIIRKEINPDLLEQTTQNDVLTARITITDEAGNLATNFKQIKIISDTSEYEIQRLSLILFDVSSAVIPQSKREEILKFLRTNSEHTQVRIIGYSDILGDRDFNYSLSEKRAKNTLELVKLFDPNIEILEAKGVGSSILPPNIFSYSTPAERFLSRTVYIELIKKWK